MNASILTSFCNLFLWHFMLGKILHWHSNNLQWLKGSIFPKQDWISHSHTKQQGFVCTFCRNYVSKSIHAKKNKSKMNALSNVMKKEKQHLHLKEGKPICISISQFEKLSCQGKVQQKFCHQEIEFAMQSKHCKGKFLAKTIVFQVLFANDEQKLRKDDCNAAIACQDNLNFPNHWIKMKPQIVHICLLNW